VKIINQLKSDYIFITGDLINNYAWELRGWDRILNQLESKKDKYAVLGNHDYGDYSNWKSTVEKKENLLELIKFYETIEFKLLMNDSDIVERGEESIGIIGVENWGNPPFKKYGDLKRAVEKVSNIPFKILLSHDPSHWSECVKGSTDISLTLSGHTHGMQAAIGIKDKKWSPIKYRYKHWAGLYGHQNQYLYVNRGLGWLGFPGRIGMRPEITSIELFRKNL
jgi:predicted MPP superfamily phosphohydrolase